MDSIIFFKKDRFQPHGQRFQHIDSIYKTRFQHMDSIKKKNHIESKTIKKNRFQHLHSIENKNKFQLMDSI